MQKLFALTLPAAAVLSACASGPNSSPPDAGKRAIVGAAAGAAVGALGGAALGDPVGGAGLGAIAGGAIGAAVPGTVFQGRQYYRDVRGYCYYVDRNGKPQ